MYANVIIFFPTRKCQKVQQLMKKGNVQRINLHTFSTSWESSMKFSGKMWLMIILKVTKNQGFTLSLQQNHIFGKTTGGAAFLGLSAVKRIVNMMWWLKFIVYVYIIVLYFKRIKRLLLEKKSGSETMEMMEVKWPYYEKQFFCDKSENWIHKIEYLHEILFLKEKLHCL